MKKDAMTSEDEGRSGTGASTRSAAGATDTSGLRGLHRQVAERIGQSIALGEYSAGQQIVPEALVQQFQVSRTVVREVLKVLETKGMIAARPRTGTRIRPQSEWHVLDADVIRWRSTGPDAARQIEELLAVRGAIEPLAARNASATSSPRDRQALVDAIEAMSAAVESQDWEAFTEADVAFHLALLVASGSFVIGQFSEPIEAALRVRQQLRLVPDLLSDEVVRSHKDILDAVIDRNGALAELASRRIVDVAGHETIMSLSSVLRSADPYQGRGEG